jgi:ribonuclease HII
MPGYWKYFYRWRECHEKYDFDSGSPADPKTRFFVWQHRNNPLPIIRKSWNTYKTLSCLDTIEKDPFYKPRKQSSQKSIDLS